MIIYTIHKYNNNTILFISQILIQLDTEVMYFVQFIYLSILKQQNTGVWIFINTGLNPLSNLRRDVLTVSQLVASPPHSEFDPNLSVRCVACSPYKQCLL